MTDEAVMPQVVVKYSPRHDGNSSPSSPSNRWRWWGDEQIHNDNNDNNDNDKRNNDNNNNDNNNVKVHLAYRVIDDDASELISKPSQ